MQGSVDFGDESESECWALAMQFGHVIAPFLLSSHPKWARWLNPCLSESESTSTNDYDDTVVALVESFVVEFERCDQLVLGAERTLAEKGYDHPTAEHLIQVIPPDDAKQLPRSLLLGFARMLVNEKDALLLDPCDELSLNDDPTDDATTTIRDLGTEDEEDLGFWGFNDSRFILRPDRNGLPTVVMTGSRYSLSNKPLPKLIPFISGETKIEIDLLAESELDRSQVPTIASDLSSEQLDSLRLALLDVSTDIRPRLRNGCGHSQEEIYQLRSGQFGFFRLPDAVVWPKSEAEVEAIIQFCAKHGISLIPHGGGTNVSQATKCPSKEVEPRPIISVDMKKMNQVLWVNEEDGLAHVEAGITGRELFDNLRERGYTMGHEPDSYEFSTLGGWVATKASGMKRGKYGNIEDIVVSIRAVDQNGILCEGKDGSNTIGRECWGLRPLDLFLGSEGCLGIITSAVVRIWPLPEKKQFESVLLPDFEAGVRFVRDVSRLGRSNLPSSVRLLDNAHFRLGQALRPESSMTEQIVKACLIACSPALRQLQHDRVVCCTIVFEGNEDEVQMQHNLMRKLTIKHSGSLVGSKIGQAGYDLTFAIAYLRDFAMAHKFLGDSFETFVPWSRLEDTIEAVKKRIRREHRDRCLPGQPFVGSRITQLYHEGACVYFYFCMHSDKVEEPSSVFMKIEQAARNEILAGGGCLSHHHGIGKIRAPFVQRVVSEPFRKNLLAIKRGIDPNNIFAARNGIFGEDDA